MTSTAKVPPWIADFCGDYTPFLFTAGRWALILGIAMGAALALTEVIVALRKQERATPPSEAALVPNTAVLEAIKGFIEALAGLRPWLALFAGGVLLLWMAGNVVPTICLPSGS